jgi:hypothetical protein
LHEHINTAYPANVCLIGTVLPNGFAQITPRGSTMVFDDEQIALWERGKGTTTENLTDGTPVTIFMRKPALREAPAENEISREPHDAADLQPVAAVASRHDEYAIGRISVVKRRHGLHQKRRTNSEVWGSKGSNRYHLGTTTSRQLFRLELFRQF